MQPARGLWGIRHTRVPVEAMVNNARSLPAGTVLPMLKITISTKGISLDFIPINRNDKAKNVFYPIDTISYGVQDVKYTRVFSMIIVMDSSFKSDTPFECHAFACDSRDTVRKLTYALATAFQEYSRNVKEGEAKEKKKFAIDLRSPEEIDEDCDETEA